MSGDKKNVERDEFTGVETTGHEWDGLKELNNPAPRWWLWVFYICCIWSVGYWVVYPAWPTPEGATKGNIGWTEYTQLADSQQEIVQRQQRYLERFEKASLEQIATDPELKAFAVAGGNAAFKDNCATCHGTGGAGAPGYPNLNDDDWLWGGTLADIYQTIQYGIRSGHDDARESAMPAFGDGMLEPGQIDTVADFVSNLINTHTAIAALDTDGDEMLSEEEIASAGALNSDGLTIFEENCASCHGFDGTGLRDFGAPNLADAIWLYGDGKEKIKMQIVAPKHGIMPNWNGRLDQNTIKQLAIYVHSLGGGE